MNGNNLSGRLFRNVYSPEGKQAEIYLIEPNGDEHLVRCLVKDKDSETIIAASKGETIVYLNDRYGSANVWSTARGIVLGN